MTGAGLNATTDVVIIGGGIAGLACALRIRAVNDSCGITLIDAASRLGGKIAGDVVDGCVVDGGADVCIGDKLRATRLFDALSLGDRVVRVNPKQLPTYESRGGELQRAPVAFNGELLTFRTGVRELVDAASAALSNIAVLTNAIAESIRPHGTARWLTQLADGRSIISDAVIVAAPARAAAALLSSVAPAEAAALCSTEYPATTTVTMAWRSGDVPRGLDGTGYLVTDASSAVTACTWSSSKNPTHAPDGIALLRGYVRGTGVDAVSLVRAELASTLGIVAAPLLTRVYEWPAGIPVYASDHEACLHALGVALASHPGLFVAGSAFHGVGIPDCIHSGERAAESAAAHLAARQSEEAA